MDVTFLGTGTSDGIPMVGCDCPVCRSSDPRDRRLRTSLRIRHAGTAVLLDTPPDLRTQCLRHGIRGIDAAFISHSHADHLFGFDDLRPLTLRRTEPLPVYATAGTAADMRRMFDYLSRPPIPGTSLAKVKLHVATGPVQAGALVATPLPAVHGRADMAGWMFSPAAPAAPRVCIITDCKSLPPATVERCRGADVLVLDALRDRPHPTHMTIAEALAAIADIRPRRAFLTNICHEVAHAELSARLPDGVAVAYDGLEIAL